VFWWWEIGKAKKEVHASPKVPMHVCDKHGTFPSSALLHITAPGTKPGEKDLPVEICPFCYDERMKAVDTILKRREKAREVKK
jgi:hypothetical protein